VSDRKAAISSIGFLVRRVGVSIVVCLTLVGIAVTAYATTDPVAPARQAWDASAAQLIDVLPTPRPAAELPPTIPAHTAPPAEPVKPHSIPDPTPEPTPTPAVAAVPDPTAAGTGAPAAGTPGAGAAAGAGVDVDPRVGGDYILVSRNRIMSLPMSGAAWSQLKAVADAPTGSPNLSNMDQENNVRVLAQALVFARTGEGAYRSSVIQNLKAAIGTEGGSALALAREAAAYALAADFIGLANADPQFDANAFRPWLRSLLTKRIEDRTLQSTHEDRANNWGTHAGGSRAAIAAYLGDGAELARTAQVFQGWLGDRNAYAGFTFGDMSWQPNPDAPVPVLPAGASLGGQSIGGALPEEMRRGGEFQWPPAGTDYPWGALEGAVLQAEILQRFGYDTYNWSDQALRRAVQFLFETAGWRPAGNDQWIFWVLDYRYGTGYRVAAPIAPGKNFAWSDWLYSQ
jgi:Alginate lyase